MPSPITYGGRVKKNKVKKKTEDGKDSRIRNGAEKTEEEEKIREGEEDKAPDNFLSSLIKQLAEKKKKIFASRTLSHLQSLRRH